MAWRSSTFEKFFPSTTGLNAPAGAAPASSTTSANPAPTSQRVPPPPMRGRDYSWRVRTSSTPRRSSRARVVHPHNPLLGRHRDREIDGRRVARPVEVEPGDLLDPAEAVRERVAV